MNGGGEEVQRARAFSSAFLPVSFGLSFARRTVRLHQLDQLKGQLPGTETFYFHERNGFRHFMSRHSFLFSPVALPFGIGSFWRLPTHKKQQSKWDWGFFFVNPREIESLLMRGLEERGGRGWWYGDSGFKQFESIHFFDEFELRIPFDPQCCGNSHARLCNFNGNHSFYFIPAQHHPCQSKERLPLQEHQNRQYSTHKKTNRSQTKQLPTKTPTVDMEAAARTTCCLHNFLFFIREKKKTKTNNFIIVFIISLLRFFYSILKTFSR